MLKWNGTGFVPNIPARDLNDDEVDRYGGEEFLLLLGIYEKPSKKKIKPVVDDNDNKRGE